eukprot:COSAG02_NODE_62044_length_267_cov_0.601190_1_plen_47_part_10
MAAQNALLSVCEQLCCIGKRFALFGPITRVVACSHFGARAFPELAFA